MQQTKVKSLDQLNETITRILSKYANDLGDELEEVAVGMGKAGAKALREKSFETFPVNNRKPSEHRDYENSWTYMKEPTRFGATVVIYSKKPSLPHLLEYEHVSRNGTGRTFGRVPGYEHITPVAEELEKRFQEEVLAKI